jgi:shikimate kinase
MRLFLVGFMGAGKTTIGRRLSEVMGVPFVDLDGEVERATGRTVRELFTEQGEGAFRGLESAALQRAAQLPEAVIATGGGTLTQESNRILIERSGASLFLNPSFATLARRISAGSKEDRPLFRDPAHAFDLYRERLPLYRACDFVLDVRDDETADEVASRAALLLSSRACAI